jgi:hypothetical protein
MKFSRAGLLWILALLTLPVLSSEHEAAPFTASQFAQLIQRVNEESGYFWNDNYVSNEASYLHPLGKLRELGIQGGVYLGVGPNQNFTYIAKLKPRYAFIIDIRRQNFLEHLLFKALFHYARDRREYLSMLLSRPMHGNKLPKDGYTVDDLVEYFRTASPDSILYSRNQARIRLFLKNACRLNLTDQDLATIDKIHRAFSPSSTTISRFRPTASFCWKATSTGGNRIF